MVFRFYGNAYILITITYNSKKHHTWSTLLGTRTIYLISLLIDMHLIRCFLSLMLMTNKIAFNGNLYRNKMLSLYSLIVH